MQAKLFFESKGTFPDNVLNVPGIGLWNIPIGGGAAAGTDSDAPVVSETIPFDCGD